MTQVRRNFFRPPAGPLYNATAAALRKTNGQEASTVLDTSMMCWKRLGKEPAGAGGRWAGERSAGSLRIDR